MGDPLDASSGVPRPEVMALLQGLEARVSNSVMENVRHEWSEDMKKLLNGAQASILTSFQLNGDPRMGIEGFIPQTKRELQELRDQRAQDREEYLRRREEDDARFEIIISRQETIKRAADAVMKLGKTLGKIADWKVWALGLLIFVLYFFPSLRDNHIVNALEHFLHGGGK